MQLTHEDLRFVVTRIPKDVRALMQEQVLFLGGGFIRETIAGQKPNDVDLFGADENILRLCGKLLAEKRDGRFFETNNAITVLSGQRMPVQLIKRWLFSTGAAVIESFDFTVCQASIWFDQETKLWQSAISDGFYPDLAARRLVYTTPSRNEDAGGSLMRVRKFLSRGYTIQAPALAGVVARLAMAVRWDDVNGREEQATKVITGLLREVDPNISIDGLDPVDEHESIEQ